VQPAQVGCVGRVGVVLARTQIQMLVVIGARRKNPGDITRQQGKIQK